MQKNGTREMPFLPTVAVISPSRCGPSRSAVGVEVHSRLPTDSQQERASTYQFHITRIFSRFQVLIFGLMNVCYMKWSSFRLRD